MVLCAVQGDGPERIVSTNPPGGNQCINEVFCGAMTAKDVALAVIALPFVALPFVALPFPRYGV